MRLTRNFKENSKMLHNYVKTKMKVRYKISSLENPSGEVCCDSKKKAELLNDQFKSVFVRERLSDIPKMERRMTNFLDILINEEIVRKKLRNLKENKVMGPDGIHLKV